MAGRTDRIRAELPDKTGLMFELRKLNPTETPGRQFDLKMVEEKGLRRNQKDFCSRPQVKIFRSNRNL